MLGSENKKKCGFGIEAVDYLYDEMALRRRGEFESHLPNCDECIAELAAVSQARFEVYDWRKIAFEPLATPVIKIPYASAVAGRYSFGQRVLVFAASISRIWALGGLAAASLLIGLWFVFSASTPSEDAVTVENTQNIVSPAPELTQPATVLTADRESKNTAREFRPPTKISDRQPKVTVARSTPKPSRVQVARNPARNNAPSRDRTAPTLSGLSTDEDSSLRLAEVFDDIGGM